MQKLNNENDHILEQELIRKYLADSLTKEEEALLAEKYQSDEDFRDALDGLEHLSVEEYEQQMSAIDQAIDKRLVKSEDEIIEPPKIIIEQGQVKPLINTKKFAIAASVILLLSLGSFLCLKLIQGPVEKVYAEHMTYKAYPDMITRGSGEELSNLEKLAISSYNTENYEISSEHFEKLSAKYPQNEKYALFLGISYLGANQPENAISALEAVQNDQSAFCNDINWYLGLAYLKIKEKGKAKEIFTKLSAADCYYNEAAKEILQKL
ncbi:MAG: hypothetical protein KDD32_02620 [Bacteroidetes bacterium]|nr:hypothetical protein [Bacteroidota bacterium]